MQRRTLVPNLLRSSDAPMTRNNGKSKYFMSFSVLKFIPPLWKLWNKHVEALVGVVWQKEKPNARKTSIRIPTRSRLDNFIGLVCRWQGDKNSIERGIRISCLNEG
jgi:hypothetical protein